MCGKHEIAVDRVLSVALKVGTIDCFGRFRCLSCSPEEGSIGWRDLACGPVFGDSELVLGSPCVICADVLLRAIVLSKESFGVGHALFT